MLTQVELFRRLMEKQAMRSMEHGTIIDEVIDKLCDEFTNLEL